ncbi:MAG: hypothetical protein IKC23_05635 [Fibrobacter sp.]|nr:hypothetical protein [Fibrobacter sp.]
MKHAIATFIFVASIAGFSGFANALPIASTTGADASKSVALDQGANQWNHFSSQDKYFRGGSIRGGSIALDQGANQWNHYSNFDKKEVWWNPAVAIYEKTGAWPHRNDDDWGINPRLV